MDWSKAPKTHPAYGTARFSRVTGNIKLFASPLDRHQNFITLTISRAELQHDTGTDWRFPREPLIEVAFSAAQFAQLLTTLNVGEGVPCTIQSIDRKPVPPLPSDEETETDRIHKDFSRSLKGLIEKISESQRKANLILSKKSVGKLDRQEIKAALANIRQEIESNLPFLVEQFQRAACKIETASKAEVEATITAAVEKLGLEKLWSLMEALPDPTSKPSPRLKP